MCDNIGIDRQFGKAVFITHANTLLGLRGLPEEGFWHFLWLSDYSFFHSLGSDSSSYQQILLQ
jgi:hypothetical protein